MKKLDELFDLPSIDVETDVDEPADEHLPTIQSVESAITISEKINGALAEVRGMEAHDGEMDDIATQAIKSYEELMSVGFNMTDMAAGPVFSNAAAMLKIALEAKDSKVTRKLKQIDLMLKKARLDQQGQNKKQEGSEEETPEMQKTWDRNELQRLLADDKESSDSDK